MKPEELIRGFKNLIISAVCDTKIVQDNIKVEFSLI